MLTLEINQTALAPAHARPTSEYLIAIQTWPGFGQARRRAEFMETCAVVRALEEAEALPATLHIGLARRAFRATDPAMFEAELARRWLEGLQVGEYYATAIGLDRVGLPVSLKHLNDFQTRDERRKAHRAVVGRSKLRDLLREYRAAAHLWTAYYILASERADYVMPCPPGQIAMLLAVSEWIADRFASIQLERRDKPLLGPGSDLWRVPPEVILPEVIWPHGRRSGVAPAEPDLWKLLALPLP